ncbi:MAG: HAD family hydrolase [Eubacterium sp.]|nr:HAD family hydrolase [Eubacterium sp.]
MKNNEKINFNNITTIIWDMDGTVLNTLIDLRDSVNYVLQAYNMPTHTIEEYKLFFGSGIKHALEMAVPKGTPEHIIEEMLPKFKEHYDIHCLDNTCPYDGILEVMKNLKEAGFKMAIVSNKIDSAVKELNEKFFSKYVDVAIGEQNGIKRKPARDMVDLAMKELGAKKEESIYIGDSEVDFQTAMNSELPCISVLWGFRDKDFLIEIGANTFANTPEELINILSK